LKRNIEAKKLDIAAGIGEWALLPTMYEIDFLHNPNPCRDGIYRVWDI